jgi:hypothetical protein
MKNTKFYTALLICTASALVFTNAAKSSNLAQPIELCAANPNCKQQKPDATGRVLFTIKRTHLTVSVRCEPDGTCWRMFPKRSTQLRENLALIFTAE